MTSSLPSRNQRRQTPSMPQIRMPLLHEILIPSVVGIGSTTSCSPLYLIASATNRIHTGAVRSPCLNPTPHTLWVVPFRCSREVSRHACRVSELAADLQIQTCDCLRVTTDSRHAFRIPTSILKLRKRTCICSHCNHIPAHTRIDFGSP